MTGRLVAELAGSEVQGCSMIEQLNLLDEPIVQIDETHWEIYAGNKIAGYFEIDATGWEFTTVRGPLIGAGGPLGKGENYDMYLNHAVNACTRNRRKRNELH